APLDAKRVEHLLGVFRLRCLERPRIDDDDLAVSMAIAERRVQGLLDHPLRRLLVVSAWLGPEGHATTAELRRASRTLPGVAGALLLERLSWRPPPPCRGPRCCACPAPRW